MGKELHQIHLGVVTELKVPQESTCVSQYLKGGGCYDLANHKGMASRFPLVGHSYVIGSKLELNAVLSKTLRKLSGGQCSDSFIQQILTKHI